MPTQLRHFRVNGKTFRHVIFTQDDDRVELRDADDNVLLTYTAHCEIISPEGHLGRFCMEGGVWVSYCGGRRYAHDFYGHEALLDSEVEFSQQWLSARGA